MFIFSFFNIHTSIQNNNKNYYFLTILNLRLYYKGEYINNRGCFQFVLTEKISSEQQISTTCIELILKILTT